jgi:hypothetical protein
VVGVEVDMNKDEAVDSIIAEMEANNGEPH